MMLKLDQLHDGYFHLLNWVQYWLIIQVADEFPYFLQPLQPL